MSEVVVSSLSNLRNEVRYGEGRSFVTDEPAEVGGEGAGPDPYVLLLAALGSCVSMTVTLYARRKGWPVERVRVRLRQRRVHAKDCSECGSTSEGFIHHIERRQQKHGRVTHHAPAAHVPSHARHPRTPPAPETGRPPRRPRRLTPP